LSEKPGFQTLTEIASVGADAVSISKMFQTRGPATVKTLLPTVLRVWRLVPAGYWSWQSAVSVNRADP